MRILKEKEYGLLKYLFSLTQAQMHKTLRTYLKTKYKSVTTTKEYIVAEGDIPIALVAHMDTVYNSPVTDLYYDQKKGVMWSPQGIGADDRAGIFAILKILESGLRPHIILTTDEEIGGVGAMALAQEYIPFKNLKYLIQLDRRGSNDCVFYDCENTDFIEYIESFGFIERFGSFSDISILCPAWNVCGVNLSVGYENEHNYIETLHINALFKTIEKVKTMLKVEDIPDFKWMSSMKYKWWIDDSVVCSHCKKIYEEYDTIPYIKKDGKLGYLCPECLAAADIEWCDNCGLAYEPTVEKGRKICNKCMAKMKVTVKTHE